MEMVCTHMNMWAMKYLLSIVVSCILMQGTPRVCAKPLPNCTYPAIYAFGDSLTDPGNSIAAFPHQFANVEKDPFGTEWPMHGADRFCDGKLLCDFLEFGVRGRPNYPYLRGIAGDFEYGTNFASSGGSARNVTGWKPENGFNAPFSQKHYIYHYHVTRIVAQPLPAEASHNQSLFMVYAGFQDYFFDLYEKKTPGEDATEILVVNLPPLGCIPALLTLYSGGHGDQYDEYGCLKELNLITSTHNGILADEILKLRAKYPRLSFYYGDLHGVYTDILKAPSTYNVTQPLKAACGYGGEYKFNEKVRCGEIG